MKTLETNFRKNGYEYELVKRNEIAAIFAQKSEGRVIAYETIIIKFYAYTNTGNHIIEGGEYYPTTKMWGKDGFTYHFLHQAEERFQKITHDYHFQESI